MRSVTRADLYAWGVPTQVTPEARPSEFANEAPTEADLSLLIGRAKAIWDEPEGKGQRSKRDFRLVLEVLRAKGTEGQACRLLWAMPGSKAKADGRGKDYWDATLASVRRHMADEERLRCLARSLPDASVDDPGAAFEPTALDALILIREVDGPAEWQRLRKELKEAKVGLRALEEAMAARGRTKDGVDVIPLRYVAEDGKRVGWFAQTREKGWVPVDGSEARSTMRAQGQDCDMEIRAAIEQPWSLVNEPFQDEELPGRLWNKDGARMAHVPAQGPHPTWDALLAHVGRSLDTVVPLDAWARGALIKTGGEYLLCWTAAMFQRPKARTAYIFLHGPQESGKSTFHEALSLLLTKGYVEAGHALRSKDGFNGEIANAVLCVVEEIDLSDTAREAHERVKKWVTGETISVRALYTQAYDLINTTRWIQCANKRSYMAVLPGDTRITEIYVDLADDPIAKDVLLAKLREEAPAFLWTCTHYKLPEATGRLLVPALETEGKQEQSSAAKTDLEEWLETHDWLELTDQQIVVAFLDWLPASSRGSWSRSRVAKELPPGARTDRALAVALREALRGRQLAATALLAALPAGPWPSTSRGLGRALARVAYYAKWLERVTIKGLDMWRIRS